MTNNIIDNQIKRSVQLSSGNGVNANGSTHTTTRTFSNINKEATAEAMYNTATLIASLLDDTTLGVYYTDKHLLIEAEDSETEVP